MVSYLYASPSGVPGDVTRVDDSNVEPIMLASPYPSNYGLPMKYATNSPGPEGVTPMTSSDSAGTNFCGVLVRQAPAIEGSPADGDFDVDVPNPLQLQGLLVRGYCTVQVSSGSVGSPVRGTAAYFCYNTTGSHVAGTFEAGASSGNNVALTGTVVGNVTWAADGVDSNGYGEIRIAQ